MALGKGYVCRLKNYIVLAGELWHGRHITRTIISNVCYIYDDYVDSAGDYYRDEYKVVAHMVGWYDAVEVAEKVCKLLDSGKTLKEISKSYKLKKM